MPVEQQYLSASCRLLSKTLQDINAPPLNTTAASLSLIRAWVKPWGNQLPEMSWPLRYTQVATKIRTNLSHHLARRRRGLKTAPWVKTLLLLLNQRKRAQWLPVANIMKGKNWTVVREGLYLKEPVMLVLLKVRSLLVKYHRPNSLAFRGHFWGRWIGTENSR